MVPTAYTVFHFSPFIYKW